LSEKQVKVEATFLHSRVARRIFALFVVCALVPTLVLTLMSFYQVSDQLRQSSRRQLMQASKARGMALVERLQMLDAESQLVAMQGKDHKPALLTGGLRDHFLSATVAGSGQANSAAVLAGLTEEQEQHLRAGKMLVRFQRCPSPTNTCIVLARMVDPDQPDAGVLLAVVDPSYLWGTENLPADVQQCVFDSTESSLVACSDNGAILGDLIAHAGQPSGWFSWADGKEQYDAGYWTLLLKPQFQTGSWIIVLSQQRSEVLAPLALFRQTFPFVILLALLIVILASLVQIRRTLVPLEKLQEGTQQIAAQNFSSRVNVHSGDEFEALATSFNSMSARLGQQFHALKTIHDIDEAILSSLNREGIMDAVLRHMPDLLPFDCFGITVLENESEIPAWTRFTSKAGGDAKQIKSMFTQVSPRDLQQLRENPEVMTVHSGAPIPGFLEPLQRAGLSFFLILPVFLEHRPFAALFCSHRSPVTATPEDLGQARQIADQLAVAFSNVQLIEALEQLHWGTLTALARAIDAKSAWTAGHSERVTNLSLKIGRAMGLPAKDLQVMHRGGLLHDIGKIGTPPSVLDKPGKLDEEEIRTMRDHVRIGLRILEPIPGFQEALPIVAQHHEWFNGAGYPEGLAGEQISLHARIFAVADCYDAMTSDRPYRKGLPKERVLAILQQNSGTQFDPKIIEVFHQLCSAEESAMPADHSAEKMVGQAT
jgi:putative nucleotidyltransferase with HDIG domain